jgi:hypothetical protein
MDATTEMNPSEQAADDHAIRIAIYQLIAHGSA